MTSSVSSEQQAEQKHAARAKRRYVRMKVQGSSQVAIVPPDQVSDFEDGEEYIKEDVWMTEAEYEALPEFEGY